MYASYMPEFYLTHVSYLSPLLHTYIPTYLPTRTQSPREEIKRYAARALGNVLWNGYIEQRILAWDVIKSWKTFEEEAVR